MAKAKLLVNCPVCEMRRPVDLIKPHRTTMQLITNEITSKGRAGIQNKLSPVEDAATRKMVLARLAEAVYAAADQFDSDAIT